MSKPKPDTHTFQIKLIIAEPPNPALGEFGIQDRDQSVHPGKQVEAGILVECEIEARISPESVDFRGRFVHGPLGDRFVYLALRGPNGAWVWRKKVELHGLTHELISAANGGPLIAHIARMGSTRVKLQTTDWLIE